MTCRTPRCFAAKNTLARTLVTKIDALSLGWDGVSRSGSDADAEVCVISQIDHPPPSRGFTTSESPPVSHSAVRGRRRARLPAGRDERSVRRRGRRHRAAAGPIRRRRGADVRAHDPTDHRGGARRLDDDRTGRRRRPSRASGTGADGEPSLVVLAARAPRADVAVRAPRVVVASRARRWRRGDAARRRRPSARRRRRRGERSRPPRARPQPRQPRRFSLEGQQRLDRRHARLARPATSAPAAQQCSGSGRWRRRHRRRRRPGDARAAFDADSA